MENLSFLYGFSEIVFCGEFVQVDRHLFNYFREFLSCLLIFKVMVKIRFKGYGVFTQVIPYFKCLIFVKGAYTPFAIYPNFP